MAKRDYHGRIAGSQKAKDDFKKQHPCPSTGKTHGSCPGYVIDVLSEIQAKASEVPLVTFLRNASALKQNLAASPFRFLTVQGVLAGGQMAQRAVGSPMTVVVMRSCQHGPGVIERRELGGVQALVAKPAVERLAKTIRDALPGAIGVSLHR